MKNIFSILFVLLTCSSFAQLGDPYRDSDQENFYLRNGKIFFQKTYNSGVNFATLEQKLRSYNNSNAGFQIKKTSSEKMNGVLLNYNLNWNYKEMKTRKVADFLKKPVNAIFEVTKNGNAYQVTVSNIWFMDVQNRKNKSHETLEDIASGKGGVVFTKNKKTLQALDMMDENFQMIFQLRGSTKDVRF